MKKGLFILLFISCFFYGQSATWIGGQSSWHKASNWDTGSVPTLGDEVIIPSGGYPKIYSGNSAEAANIIIETNARLQIYFNGELIVNKGNVSSGIVNNGSMYIFGKLEVYDFQSTGIVNDGSIYSYGSATLTIHTTGFGFKNGNSSYFYNAGTTSISDCKNTGIINHDRFKNYGQLFIFDIGGGSSSYGTGMFNADYFYNGSNALVDIKNTNSHGIATDQLYNHGEIFISNTGGIEISINETLINYKSGNITCINGGNSAFYLSTATVENHGTMKGINPHWAGVWMDNSIFENYGTIELLFPNSSRAIAARAGSYFYNYGNTTLATNQNVEIALGDASTKGYIINGNGAVFEMSKRMITSNSSSFTNDGFLYYNSTVSSSSNGFNNFGVIQDKNNTFPAASNNQQVIVHPFVNNLTVGVPYPNALGLGATDEVIIGDWRTGPNASSDIAGIYKPSSNAFTPDLSAVGASELYVEITDAASGLSHYFEIPIQGNISTFSGGSNLVFQKRTSEQKFGNESSKAYPNPSTGTLFLKNDCFTKGDTEIRVYNTLGQLVFQTKVDKGEEVFSMDMPESLSDGLYRIQSIQNDQTVAVQQVQLQRN